MITDHSCAGQTFYPKLGVYGENQKRLFILSGERIDTMVYKFTPFGNRGEGDCSFKVRYEGPDLTDKSNTPDGKQQVSKSGTPKPDRHWFILSRPVFYQIIETAEPKASYLVLDWEPAGKLRLQLKPAFNQDKTEKTNPNPQSHYPWFPKEMEHQYVDITIGAQKYRDNGNTVFFDFGRLESKIPEAAYKTIVELLGNRDTSSDTFDCELAENALLPDIIINLDNSLDIKLKKEDYRS